MQLCYGIALARRDFVDLDSSTASKFSRHLVCHAPCGSLFRSNEHMKDFIQSLVMKLEAHPATRAALWVNAEGASRAFLADLGVYTKCVLPRVVCRIASGAR